MRLLHDCHRATRGQRRRALHRVQTPRVTRHGLPARMLPCRCARSHSALTESTSLWPSARRCRPGRSLRPTPARRRSMPPPVAPLRARCRRLLRRSAHNGSSLQVWTAPGLVREFAPLKLHRTYTGHFGEVRDVRWSADSAFIVTGSADMSCRIYSLDPIAGACSFCTAHPSRLRRLEHCLHSLAEPRHSPGVKTR